jgi:CheY-like chemotaxis protein
MGNSRSLAIERRSGVLVVEDDSYDVALVRLAFARSGSEVPLHFIHTAEEALRYLEGEADFADRERFPFPALLLLDLKFPAMSGFELIEWVRSDPQLRTLPIIVLSSSRDPADSIRAYALGANAYHVKPADLNALIGMVQGVQRLWLGRT